MTEAWVLTFVLVLVRVATFWGMLPIWSTVKPPRMVQLGLILSLTTFWIFSLEAPVPASLEWATGTKHWSMILFLGVQEILLGALLAVIFYVFFVPMQIAGAYIAQELGLSMATLTDSNSGATNSVVATTTELCAVVLFFVLDLHHYLLYTLHASFQLLPAGSSWNTATIGTALEGFAEVTEQGILTCSPVAIISMIALISLLILARAVPALNLFSVGLPLRLLIGLFALLYFMPAILARLVMHFRESLYLVQRLLESL